MFDIASQRNQYFKRYIWDQSWPNFMLIKTTYPNFLHGSDFFCFLAYELLMSLRTLIQLRFNVESTCINTVENRTDVEANVETVLRGSLFLFPSLLY